MDFSFDRAAEAKVLASAATLVLAVAVVSYRAWRARESSRMRNFVRGQSAGLPSPMPALPTWGFGALGGHTLAMQKGKSVAQIEGWAQEFGGDYELRLVGTRVVCVTGLADIRRIMTLRPSKFKRGLVANQSEWAGRQLGVNNAMFNQEGKAWGRSRRLISPNLIGHNLTAMLPVVAKTGERFCAMLEEKAAQGEIVKASDSFARFTHDTIALAAFGLDVGSISATPDRPCHSYDAIESKTTAYQELIAEPLAIWQWKLLPTLSWVRRVKKHGRNLEKVIQGAINALRFEAEVPGTPAAGDVGIGGTLLRKIMRATSTKGGSTSDRMLFSDEEILHEATSLFVAGTETTAITLCWAMYYLTKRRDALLRCRTEALRAAPSSDGMVSTTDQLSQLEFCSAVFKEALRLRTPAPMMTFNCTGDFTFESGTVLEEGTGIVVLTRAAGVSDEFFTRGKEFVPERWIEAEREEALLGKGEARDGKGGVVHEEKAFLSLGHGPRICPGQDMAKAEGAIIIAAICARFDFSYAPGQADPPEEVASFTCGPEEFDMIFTRREKSA